MLARVADCHVASHDMCICQERVEPISVWLLTVSVSKSCFDAPQFVSNCMSQTIKQYYVLVVLRLMCNATEIRRYHRALAHCIIAHV